MKSISASLMAFIGAGLIVANGHVEGPPSARAGTAILGLVVIVCSLIADAGRKLASIVERHRTGAGWVSNLCKGNRHLQ